MWNPIKSLLGSGVAGPEYVIRISDGKSDGKGIEARKLNIADLAEVYRSCTDMSGRYGSPMGEVRITVGSNRDTAYLEKLLYEVEGKAKSDRRSASDEFEIISSMKAAMGDTRMDFRQQDLMEDIGICDDALRGAELLRKSVYDLGNFYRIEDEKS